MAEAELLAASMQRSASSKIPNGAGDMGEKQYLWSFNPKKLTFVFCLFDLDTSREG